MDDLDRMPRRALRDLAFPGYAMSAAADAIGVTPAFLRAAEAAGLFQAHRSGGGHRRYSQTDLQKADRARQLVDEGLALDAVVRIVALEYQLAAAQTMIVRLRAHRKAPSPGHPEATGGASAP